MWHSFAFMGSKSGADGLFSPPATTIKILRKPKGWAIGLKPESA
jgi:hypothetical protein